MKYVNFSIYTVFMLVIGIAIGFVFAKTTFDGPQAKERADSRNAVAKTEQQPPKIIDECLLTVNTDPSGATVLRDNVSIGTAPTRIPVRCTESITLVFKMQGFETEQATILVDKKEKAFHKSLRKVPMGAVEFSLDEDARVFVDGEDAGEALANKPFTVPVRAGIMHKLRFMNTALKFDVSREYRAEDGIKKKYAIKLKRPLDEPPWDGKPRTLRK